MNNARFIKYLRDEDLKKVLHEVLAEKEQLIQDNTYRKIITGHFSVSKETWGKLRCVAENEATHFSVILLNLIMPFLEEYEKKHGKIEPYFKKFSRPSHRGEAIKSKKYLRENEELLKEIDAEIERRRSLQGTK